MSANVAPNIVRNGLVLELDAANTKSYPGTGTSWTDLTANAYNGTLTNGPTFNSGNGGSIVFDGTNDYILTTYLPGTITQQTIGCWINKLNTQYSFILADSSLYFGFEIYPTTIYVNINNDKYGQVSYDINGWQNIVFTYDGSQPDNPTRLKIYLNGNIQTPCYTGTIPNSVSNIPAINIGRRWWSTIYSQGKIAQTSIYNRALSATEVLQNYNALKSRFGL